MLIASPTDIKARRDKCRECSFATKNPARASRPTKGLVATSICQKGAKSPLAKAGETFLKIITADYQSECPIGLWSKSTPIEAPDPPTPEQAKKLATDAIESAKAEWGPPLWKSLHEWAKTADLTKVSEWLTAFALKIKTCGGCRSHWLRLVKANPPDTSSHDNLFAWTVARHNDVNRAKMPASPQMPLPDARHIYGLP